MYDLAALFQNVAFEFIFAMLAVSRVALLRRATVCLSAATTASAAGSADKIESAKEVIERINGNLQAEGVNATRKALSKAIKNAALQNGWQTLEQRFEALPIATQKELVQQASVSTADERRAKLKKYIQLAAADGEFDGPADLVRKAKELMAADNAVEKRAVAPKTPKAARKTAKAGRPSKKQSKKQE